MNRAAAYRKFSVDVVGIRAKLRTVLRELKKEGRSVAAYGASAKGSTLLNYAGIGAETLDFVVDRSTVKQGRFTPGTHLPIYSGGEAARGNAGLRAAAHVEFRRRDSRAAGGVSGAGREVRDPDS